VKVQWAFHKPEEAKWKDCELMQKSYSSLFKKIGMFLLLLEFLGEIFFGGVNCHVLKSQFPYFYSSSIYEQVSWLF